MRQAGYLAAAGSYALKHHRKELNEDHRKAKEIEAVLLTCDFVDKVEPVSTNIIIFSLNSPN
jgi:threonine aldolase